ncbi:MAG: PilC/PilY family type IV pilus protein [Aquificota bacterium]|nr:PilC/PilY family type IV pilus protein [Aquificota bacterium]
MNFLGQTYDINVEAVYALGLFLGGTGENSLKHVAMYGSFDLSAGDWPGGTSYYPTVSGCWIDDCTVYTDGTADDDDKGSPCTPIPSSSPDWDRNGDGLPDTFLNARNAIEIKRSLLAFIRDILKRTSAASSVSILSRRGTAGQNVIQAVFYPQKPFPNENKLDWVGYLYNYWFYQTPSEQSIREDTNRNRILDLDQDYKLKFVVDSAGNLKIEAYDNNDNLVTVYNSLDEVNPLWEAGEILKNTDPASRNIYTVDVNGNMVEFTVANKSSFAQLLGDTASFPQCLSASGDPVDNLINFIRGSHVDGCRDRRVDQQGNTWKLGDIVYSTPAIVDYGDFGMVFVGANDGMLHAFRLGALRTDGLSANQVVKLCDQLTGNCTDLEIGKEEWAFIPQNVLPYLRELADPNYVHRYFVDLQPYIIRLDTNNDGFPDRAVLIGGMRLGGGCGCTDPACENPPPDVCNPNDPANCRGLSSYFALDITDPFNPRFLWEFTHPDLGFSYSGPAHITKGGKHFVMFLSGPTDPCGNSVQELKIFVLEMDTDCRIARRYIFYGNATPALTDGYTVVSVPALARFSRAFGGRLFTEGVDGDGDGETDAVFFGVNWKPGQGQGKWKGNVMVVRVTGSDPTNWDVQAILNFPQGKEAGPVTAKVEHMRCFGMNYIFFGTGRWFYRDDEPGDPNNSADTEALYGVRIDDCLENGNCNINQAKNSAEACQELQSGSRVFAWKVELDPRGGGYFKERAISDPAVTDFDVVFFATTKPTDNICGFGGDSRLWGLNCATGDSLLSTACPGFIAQVPPEMSVLLQLSRGNIEQFGRKDFEGGKRATKEVPGTTPESPPAVPGGQAVRGKMILWIER